MKLSEITHKKNFSLLREFARDDDDGRLHISAKYVGGENFQVDKNDKK